MGLSRFIVPTLALVGTTLAQNCNGPSITISSSTDAEAIASCQTYKGDVIIDQSASGTIQLNGVQAISGDLTCNNATQLTAITSDQLNSIGGTFGLNGLTILSTLQFDSLTAVNMISWVALPALQGLNMGQGISEANSIVISNTQLNSLSGIELTAVGSMDVNNNNYLTTINVNDLKNITDELSFSANGMDLEVNFPNLVGAANLTFRNVSAISMPSLSQVSGAMGFYSNLFSSFAAPNLTTTGGSLAFIDCPSVSNVSFPLLTEVGGGMILANNSDLKAITGFPQLTTIVGALDFAGTFNKVSLPKIHDIRGGASVETTSTNQAICNEFDQAHSQQIIKGTETCQVGKANPSSNPNPTGSSSSSASSGSSSKNGAGSYDPSAPLTGLSAIIAALLFI